MVDTLANIAGAIVSTFSSCGEIFWGFVTGIIPLVLMLLTFMNALTIFIGEHRVNKFAKHLGRFAITRYTIMPALLCICATGLGAEVLVSKLLEDKYKPAYLDAVFTFLHPSAGIFPHVHASEVFVYMGIASGLTTAGVDTGGMAIGALLVVFPIMLIRGIITQAFFNVIYARNMKKKAELEGVAE